MCLDIEAFRKGVIQLFDLLPRKIFGQALKRKSACYHLVYYTPKSPEVGAGVNSQLTNPRYGERPTSCWSPSPLAILGQRIGPSLPRFPLFPLDDILRKYLLGEENRNHCQFPGFFLFQNQLFLFETRRRAEGSQVSDRYGFYQFEANVMRLGIPMNDTPCVHVIQRIHHLCSIILSAFGRQ